MLIPYMCAPSSQRRGTRCVERTSTSLPRMYQASRHTMHDRCTALQLILKGWAESDCPGKQLHAHRDACAGTRRPYTGTITCCSPIVWHTNSHVVSKCATDVTRQHAPRASASTPRQHNHCVIGLKTKQLQIC